MFYTKILSLESKEKEVVGWSLGFQRARVFFSISWGFITKLWYSFMLRYISSMEPLQTQFLN